MTIIDDVYNANPASMVEAIKVLCLAKGRKIAILGDMNELGHIAEQRHRELGKYAASAGIDLLFTVGELSRFTHEESLCTKSSKAIHCDTICELLPILNEKLQAADTVLVKASRGAAFERIIQWIYQ
jgi:UDP-N-acetylmuramoyl-tripeptide--D-alanyl-D-alanine ligase